MPDSEFQQAMQALIVGEIYEMVGKIRNAVEASNTTPLAYYAGNLAVYGACLVGLLLLAVPAAPLSLQLFVWAAASAACTWFWFRYFKPKMVDRTRARMSQEAIVGQTGMMLRGGSSHLERGRIRFAVPVLGAEEWDCISNDTLRAGDYARVTGIEGHVLTVEKKPSHV